MTPYFSARRGSALGVENKNKHSFVTKRMKTEMYVCKENKSLNDPERHSDKELPAQEDFSRSVPSAHR